MIRFPNKGCHTSIQLLGLHVQVDMYCRLSTDRQMQRARRITVCLHAGRSSIHDRKLEIGETVYQSRGAEIRAWGTRAPSQNLADRKWSCHWRRLTLIVKLAITQKVSGTKLANRNLLNLDQKNPVRRHSVGPKEHLNLRSCC